YGHPQRNKQFKCKVIGGGCNPVATFSLRSQEQKPETAMLHQTLIVASGPDDHSVRSATVEILHPPSDWILLPPGDATLTRRVKVAGPTWTVQEKRGRKVFSAGAWAPAAVVEQV